MAKKTTDRDRQAAATRKKIYRCGVRLMNRCGYENITVAQIAEKAHVSVGTFYHYFASKFSLLVEVYRLGDVFFTERVPALLRQYEACPEAHCGLLPPLCPAFASQRNRHGAQSLCADKRNVHQPWARHAGHADRHSAPWAGTRGNCRFHSAGDDYRATVRCGAGRHFRLVSARRRN